MLWKFKGQSLSAFIIPLCLTLTMISFETMSYWKALLKFLDITLFLIFLSAAIGFIWQGLMQYLSKDTSFKRAEKPVTELPTVTFCLKPPDFKVSDWGPPYDYVLGKNFNISYLIYDDALKWTNISSEGRVNIAEYSETIQVLQVATNYNCYKFNTTGPKIIGVTRSLKLDFLSQMNKSKLPEEVLFTLTSEDNVYSVLFGKRMNGKTLQHTTKMGFWAVLSIKAEKFIYLKETSGCTDLSFWDQWEPIYSDFPGFENCLKKCSAVSLPNNRYCMK